LKSAIITGGSRGIGYAAALALTEEYPYIAICGRNEDTLKKAHAELTAKGISCHAFCGDVSDYNFVKTMIDTVAEEAGGIDLLINNAAISEVGLFTDLTVDQWHNIVNVNVSSVFNTCHLAVPYMLKKQEGRIINISSVWGTVGASCEVAYSATKGAVDSLTKALAKELAPCGISVNAIAFGAIDTEMNHHLSQEERIALEDEIPYGRMATPEEAATCLQRVISMPTYLTGEIIKFDGGWI